MSNLMQASNQWSSRPADERYVSLIDMRDHFEAVRSDSKAVVVPSRKVEAVAVEDNGLIIRGPNGHDYAPTHWSFGQLAQLAEAPAGYLRGLPSEMSAGLINFGLQVRRDVSDVGVLLYKNGGAPVARAFTGPNYGRIWNADIVNALVSRFGDGVSGPTFKVPGEFGQAVEVTKQNTTLYASDRDMFVFLADEQHRIEIPNRRDGQAGELSRGFFVWNSEVGDKTFGIATFLFDYVCCNRIVWGAAEYKEVTMRHTASAPVKFIEEIAPALESYAKSSTASVTKAIEDARSARIEDVSAFLAKQFGKKVVAAIEKVHELEEGRPIETLWDATTAVTAYARGIEHQDRRVELERQAGGLLAMA